MTQQMSPELTKHLVETNGVKQPIIDAMLKHGVFEMVNFVQWAEKRSDWDKLLATVPKEGEGSIPPMMINSEGGRLKQAWQQAEKLNDKTLEHQAACAAKGVETLPTHGIDDPLHPEVFEKVKKTFEETYNFTDYDLKLVGCESMQGRFRRQFESSKHTMWNILRARSMLQSQNAPKKQETKVGDLTIAQTAPQTEAASLHSWFNCFEVTVNTLAIVGCFDYVYRKSEKDEQTVKYCHWQKACAYLQLFRAEAFRLMATEREQDIFSYLFQVEEAMRGEAMQYSRGSKLMPWGLALETAAKENAYLWRKLDYLLPNADSEKKKVWCYLQEQQ